MNNPETDSLASLHVLADMITPAVLIMVCGTLTLSTSQRLNRLIERTRRLFEDQKNRKGRAESSRLSAEEQHLLTSLLRLQTKRVKYLQQTMTLLYITIGLFVLTSLAIGLVETAGVKLPWLPLSFGLIGGLGLARATISLISESLLALKAVKIEMNFIVRLLEDLREGGKEN